MGEVYLFFCTYNAHNKVGNHKGNIFIYFGETFSLAVLVGKRMLNWESEVFSLDKMALDSPGGKIPNSKFKVENFVLRKNFKRARAVHFMFESHFSYFLEVLLISEILMTRTQ
jgi:hypothetical protein